MIAMPPVFGSAQPNIGGRGTSDNWTGPSFRNQVLCVFSAKSNAKVAKNKRWDEVVEP